MDLVEKLEVTGSTKVYVSGWKEAEREYLMFCFDYRFIMIGEFRELVKQRLCKIGRENYNWAIVRNTSYTRYPDHCSSPIALAYALLEGEFTEEEKALLKFDHGQTLYTFFVEEGKKLLDTVMHHVCPLE
jgi:hypothetical protein